MVEELRTGYMSLCTTLPDLKTQKCYQLSRRIVGRMAAIARSRQQRFLLVTLDNPAHDPAVETKLRNLHPNSSRRGLVRQVNGGPGG